MFQFEIDLRAGRDAERFNTAVYRFLELHGHGVGVDLVKIETRPDGLHERKTLTLWSPESVVEFQSFWDRARRG